MTATPFPLSRLRLSGERAFFQPQRAAFWVYTALFLFFLFIEAKKAVSTPPMDLLIAVAVWSLWLLVPLWLFQRLDLFEPEPRSLRLAAFGWGAIIVVGSAAEANTALGGILGKMAPDALALRGALLGPSTEEPLKALGVVMILLIARRHFNRLMDGFIYGALCGLGFEFTENIFYTLSRFESSPGSGYLGNTLFVFAIRGLTAALWSHAAYTALAGVGIAYFVTRRGAPLARRVAVMVGMFAIAYAGHTIHNGASAAIGRGSLSPGLFLALALNVLVGFTILVMTAKWVRRAEFRWFSRVMRDELDAGVLTAAEAHSLSTLRMRRLARRAAQRAGGRLAGDLTGDLQRTQSAYAVAKDRGDATDMAKCRTQIAAIRAELSSAT